MKKSEGGHEGGFRIKQALHKNKLSKYTLQKFNTDTKMTILKRSHLCQSIILVSILVFWGVGIREDPTAVTSFGVG